MVTATKAIHGCVTEKSDSMLNELMLEEMKYYLVSTADIKTMIA